MIYNEFNLKGCENQTGFEKFEPRKHLNPETDTSENSVCLILTISLLSCLSQVLMVNYHDNQLTKMFV